MAMKTPAGLKYTKDHEWARIEEDSIVVGVTHHAQDSLGEVVFVELPAVGAILKPHQTFGVVESIKAVSDLYSPLAGKVLEVNSALVNEPGAVNSDPYGAGWMIKILPSDKTEMEALLNATQYTELVEASH
ncbi:MAG: glycine cleavage system protein GcvH [Bdellovibrionota bacterium]